MKYLRERGVAATQMSPDRFSLHVEGRRPSILEQGAEGFLFSCWDHAPGPGKDDFRVAFDELDDALLAVWYFYFGEPVGVDEWRVPMHRHPNWSLGKLTYRIAQAVHVGASQFEAAAQSRRDHGTAFASSPGGGLSSQDRYAAALRSQFIACPSMTTASRTLMLRRDLEEAYVVDDRP